MKTTQARRNASGNTTNHFNTVFNAPVGTANIGSTIHAANTITITTQLLDDVDKLSEGNPQLQSAALELRNAHTQGGNAVEKMQKWATLVNTVGGLAEKIHQHYPHVASLVSHWFK